MDSNGLAPPDHPESWTKSWQAGVSLDLFNLFNDDAFTDVATTLSGPGTEDTFGVGSVFVPPRRLMVGLKLHF